MSIQALIQDVIDIKTAVTAGDYKTADQKLIDAHQEVHNLAFGSPLMLAASPQQTAELQTAVADCVTACESAKPRMGAEVGKIGDGKILDLITKLLPIILSLFA